MVKYVFRTILLLGFVVTGLAIIPVANSADDSEQSKVKEYPLDAGLYYTIKKGDTLWDLSNHFFDSPWVWPDLWEKNQKIPNPHWIYPGNRIRIYNRKGLEKILTEPTPLAAKPSVSEVSEAKKPVYYYYPAMDSVGFIKKKALDPWGVVSKVSEDKEVVGTRDRVYVQPTGKMPFKSGDRFTIFRTLDTIRDIETGMALGIEHYIVGILEINDVQPEFAMAKVVDSYRHIEKGDLLVPYKERSPKIKISESKRDFNGKIIAGVQNQALIGAMDIVFVDQGRKDGIKTGQYYGLYYHEEAVLNKKEKVATPLFPIDMGSILILHVEETTATGLVTAAKKDIEPGMKLRTPQTP